MLGKIFLQILNMSLTGAFVIAFVLAVRLLLKKAPKVISYALWSVVLFRLVCPFSFESGYSLLPAKASPILHNFIYMQTPKLNPEISVINNTVNSILPSAAAPASVNPRQIWISIGSVIWLLGIAALLMYSLVTLLQLKKRLRGATLCKDNIFLSDKIGTAFVMGVFRPRIYLPCNLNDTERDYILLHEQTHIRRLDHLVKLTSFFVLCIHWFNPLVWAAFFVSGRDMEMSCDEAVIKHLGNDVKKDYSTSLLTLATGRRLIGGTPLAFGEGDTKERIKNVLHYKKPAFWVIAVSLAAVVCVSMGLMTNPKDKKIGFSGVNAVILKIDREGQTMTVKGTDRNSVIGDTCILTWEANPFITVGANEPVRLSLTDFSVGDSVVLFIGEVRESNPTRAKATTIQLQPKETHTYSTEQLWNARTKHVGDNSAVGKLLGQLPLPVELRHKQFELLTSANQRGIKWILDKNAPYKEKDLNPSALLLFALIDNLEDFYITIKDSTGGATELHFNREWANNQVGGDVRLYAASPEKLQELTDSFGEIKASYSITKLQKNKETLFQYSAQSEQLAQAIVMDAMTKSTLWEGVNITTLEESYRIRQSFPETQEVHDYYAYRLKDGTAVLQSGEAGRYSILSDNLYESLAKYVTYPDTDSTSEAVRNTNYSRSLTAEELKQTEEIARKYFTSEAPYYEGVVAISLMPDDDYLYQNTGIEGKYEAGNIIIYKVLTGRDKKDHNPERSVSVARASKNAAWEVINHGY